MPSNHETNERPQSYTRYAYYHGADTRPAQPRPTDCVPWKLLHPTTSKPVCALCGAASDKPLVELPVNVLLQVTDNLFAPGCNAHRPSDWDGHTADLESETLDVCAGCLDSMDLHLCVECDEWILPYQSHTALNQRRGVTQYIHDGCLDRSDWFQCADCNEWTEDERRSNCQYEDICERCGENYYGCDRCGDIVHSDDIHCAHDSCYCESCFDRVYTVCYSCSEPVAHEDTRSYRDESYCPECYNDLDLVTCDNCGEVIESDDCADHDNGDYVYCRDCVRPLSGPTNRIHSYGTKPRPTFHGATEADGRALHMGVELEIHAENRSDVVEKIGEQMNQDHLYLKSDGSLDAYKGVELVSQPCTLDYHQSEFRWNDLLSMLRSNQCTSHDARKNNQPCCGLHVHISRAFFRSEIDECKVGVFFYTHFRPVEDGAEKTPINKLARRDPGFYCSSSDWRKDSCKNGSPHEDHYDAVNYEHKATIEIRCARGTLKEVAFFGWLELVDAVAHWVQTVSIAVCGLDESWTTFVEWVKLPENQARYSHLIAYLEERHV